MELAIINGTYRDSSTKAVTAGNYHLSGLNDLYKSCVKSTQEQITMNNQRFKQYSGGRMASCGSCCCWNAVIITWDAWIGTSATTPNSRNAIGCAINSLTTNVSANVSCFPPFWLRATTNGAYWTYLCPSHVHRLYKLRSTCGSWKSLVDWIRRS